MPSKFWIKILVTWFQKTRLDIGLSHGVQGFCFLLVWMEIWVEVAGDALTNATLTLSWLFYIPCFKGLPCNPLKWNSGLTTWLKCIIQLATNKWVCLTSYSWWNKLKILFSTGVSEARYWHCSCSSRPAMSCWCVFALSLLSLVVCIALYLGCIVQRASWYLFKEGIVKLVLNTSRSRSVKIPGEVQLNAYSSCVWKINNISMVFIDSYFELHSSSIYDITWNFNLMERGFNVISFQWSFIVTALSWYEKGVL